MTEEIQEMVVRVKPEGVEETEEALESEAETFEETAATAKEESGTLDTFSRKWRGAMTVIVGALTVAAAGLATQVPVVSDLMDGLMAIVEAIGIQMDQTLRPALGVIVDGLFELAQAVGEAEGPLGAVIGVLGTFAATVGSGLGLAAVTGNLATVLGLLARFAGPIGIAVTAITALAAAWRTNFGDIRGITAGAVAEIDALLGEHLPYIIESVAPVLGLLGDFWAEWGDEIETVTSYVFDAIATIIVQALDTLLTVFSVGLALLQGDWEAALGFINSFWERTFNRMGSFAERWYGGILTMTSEWGASMITTMRTILSEWQDAFDRFIVNAIANYDAFWTRLAISTVTGANTVIDRLESFLNRYVEAYNSIASQVGAPTVGQVSMGNVSTGGLRRNLSNVESQRASRLGAIDERSERRGRNIYVDRQEMVVRFEPAEFERFVSGELADDPANRGRTSGVR